MASRSCPWVPQEDELPPTVQRFLGPPPPPISRAPKEEARLDMGAVDHYLRSMEVKLQHSDIRPKTISRELHLQSGLIHFTTIPDSIVNVDF